MVGLAGSASLRSMPTRRALPHLVPFSIDPNHEVWFVTVCCKNRHVNSLAQKEIAASLIDTVRHRHDLGQWWIWLVLFMPDHVHLLLSFPQGSKGLSHLVTEWKRWSARTLGIEWQRDFFDHRLRRDESFSEKTHYILNNPVRAGLAKRWEDWPYFWSPENGVFTGIHR